MELALLFSLWFPVTMRFAMLWPSVNNTGGTSIWLGFHHILEYLGRHEQQIARDLRQNIGGPQGSSLEPLPAWPPGGSKRGIFTAAGSWENRTRMTRA